MNRVIELLLLGGFPRLLGETKEGYFSSGRIVACPLKWRRHHVVVSFFQCVRSRFNRRDNLFRSSLKKSINSFRNKGSNGFRLTNIRLWRLTHGAIPNRFRPVSVFIIRIAQTTAGGSAEKKVARRGYRFILFRLMRGNSVRASAGTFKNSRTSR